MTSQDIAVFVASMSAAISLASLALATMSYRRARPKLVIRKVRIATQVRPNDFPERSPKGSNLPAADADASYPLDQLVMVEGIVINRGQGGSNLTVEERDNCGFIKADFRRARWRRRYPADSRTRLGHERPPGTHHLLPLYPVQPALDADGLTVGPFSGVAFNGFLDDLHLVGAAGRPRMRLVATTSSGDMVTSRWMRAPDPDMASWRHRIRKAQRDCPQSAAQLLDIIRPRWTNVQIANQIRSWEPYDQQRWAIKGQVAGRHRPTWGALLLIREGALKLAGPAERDEIREWEQRWREHLDLYLSEAPSPNEPQRSWIRRIKHRLRSS